MTAARFWPNASGIAERQARHLYLLTRSPKNVSDAIISGLFEPDALEEVRAQHAAPTRARTAGTCR